MEKIQIDLTKDEATLLLNAVELLQDACAAAVETEEVQKLGKVWDRVFDTGVEAMWWMSKE